MARPMIKLVLSNDLVAGAELQYVISFLQSIVVLITHASASRKENLYIGYYG